MPKIFEKINWVFLRVFARFRTLSRKQKFLLLLTIVPVAIFFPFSSALALVAIPMLTQLVGLGIRAVAAVAIIKWAVQLIISLAYDFMGVGASVLQWVAKNPINLSFTNPAGNPIIEIGWTLLRDITNSFFVLGLAYIGLSTALNIGGFNTKKAFAYLLIIALLINFTPVICGIIVDISNIIANFFLRIDVTTTQTHQIVFRELVAELLVDKLDMLDFSFWGKWIIIAAYGWFVVFVFFLLAGLLIIRHIAIWILVILSPLAFFAFIFEKTRKYFKAWWEEFIRWSFIAIPLGFFLYLSQQLAVLFITREDLILIPGAGPSIKGVGWIARVVTFFAGKVGGEVFAAFLAVLPTLIVTIFLFFGYKLSKKTAPKIANSIVSWAAGVGLGAVTTAAGLGWKGLKKGTKIMGDTATGMAQGAMLPGEGTGRIMGALKGGFTAEGRERGRETGEKLLERAHVVRPGFYEAQRAKRFAISEKEQKMLEGMSDDRIREAMERKAVTPAEQRRQAAMAGILAKRNKFLFKDAQGNIDEAKERRFIERAQSFGVDMSEIAKSSRPDLTPIFKTEELKEEVESMKQRVREANVVITPDIEMHIQRSVRQKLITDQIEGMTPRVFRDRVTAPEVLKQPEIFMGLDANKITDIGLRGSKEQKNTIFGARESEALFNFEQRLWDDEEILRNAGLNEMADEVVTKIERIWDNTNDINDNPNF